MVNGDINKKRYFSGNHGWKIYWDIVSEVSIFAMNDVECTVIFLTIVCDFYTANAEWDNFCYIFHNL